MRRVLVVLIVMVLAVGAGIALWYPYVDPARRAPHSIMDMQAKASWSLIVFVSGRKDDNYARLVWELMDSLRVRAERAHAVVSTVGVAFDERVAAGIARLKEFGAFDEVIVGRNWLNTAATTYIWRDFPGPSAQPQVVLLTEPLHIGQQGVVVGQARVLERRIGFDGLREWRSQSFAVSGEDRRK